MRNRTISFVLCLMMVVSLFAGCLTSASAADLPGTVTIDPAKATIEGTGTARFTAVTAIDGLSDQIKKGNNIDLSKWLEGLKDQGFDLEQLTGLLSDSGFDWDTIVKSLEGAGFNINDIASMFAGDDGNFDLSKVFSDLAGDNETLSSLLKALNSEDGKKFDVSALSDLLKDAGFDVESILGENFDLNSLLGKLTDLFGGKKADTLADDEPAAGDSSVTDLVASKLIDSLSEKYGKLFTESRKEQLQKLFDQGKPVEDIIAQLPEIFGKDFDLNKTVEAIFDATDGKFDIGKIVEGLSDAGVPLDKLSEAIGNSSFGDKLDLDKLTEALTNAMNEDGKFDLDKLVDDLAKAMGDDFDPAAIASSVLEKAGLDTDSETLADLMDALQKAANGEETDLDLSSVVDAIMDKLPGKDENAKLSELVEALEQALEGTDSEEAQQKIIDALKNQIDTDNIQSIIDSLKDSMGEDFDPAAIAGALADALGGDMDSSMITSLIDALKGATDGEDSSFDLQEIVNSLMGEGTKLSELIKALKGEGEDADSIADLLVGGSLTYKWFVRDGKDVVDVSTAKDKNTYAGADTKTLEVSRKTAPKETETYTYFCTVSVDSMEASLDSNDAVLTIQPAGEKPDDGKDDDSKTDASVPVLDNENHIAYIHGYGDDTVRPNANITRAEAATIFYNLMTADSREKFASTANSFPDVKKDAWYNEYVSTLARASVLIGYEDGTFKPNKEISRAEMATILTRFEVLNKDFQNEVKAVSFKDVSSSHWAAKYIKTAANNGWIAGYTDGTFKPDAPITRAETVTMVNRVLNRNPQSLEDMVVDNTMIVFKDNANQKEWYFLQIQEAANGHDFTRDKDGFEKWTATKNEK